MAKKLLSGGASVDQAVEKAYPLALGRAADPKELAVSVGFVTAATQSYAAGGKMEASELALADFCQVLFSLNEFVYIE
jgi:hypothetical protein